MSFLVYMKGTQCAKHVAPRAPFRVKGQGVLEKRDSLARQENVRKIPI